MNSSISDGFVYVLKQNKEFLDNKQIKFNDNIFSIECFNHYLGTDISGSDKNELYIIKKAIEDKKGSEISVFNTSMYNSIYDYVVICSSLNDKNLLAICDSVEDSLLENHYKIHHIEGKRSGQWIIIDAYNFVIHIMIKDVRKKYDLDQIFLDKTN
jgi:ribosome-associated protein